MDGKAIPLSGLPHSWLAHLYVVKGGTARSAVRVATIYQWGKDEIKFAPQAP